MAAFRGVVLTALCHLAAAAGDQVAATILLHRLAALWALLRIGRQPVSSKPQEF